MTHMEISILWQDFNLWFSVIQQTTVPKFYTFVIDLFKLFHILFMELIVVTCHVVLKTNGRSHC